jgi:hypothetical protein
VRLDHLLSKELIFFTHHTYSDCVGVCGVVVEVPSVYLPPVFQMKCPVVETPATGTWGATSMVGL